MPNPETHHKMNMETETSSTPSETSPTPLMTRYADAYQYARMIVKGGDLLDAAGPAGFIVGALIAVLWCIVELVKGNFGNGVAVFIACGGSGVLFWLLTWLAGFLMKVAAQMMMSQLDIAVNTSFILSNEQKEEIMSIK